MICNISLVGSGSGPKKIWIRSPGQANKNFFINPSVNWANVVFAKSKPTENEWV